MKCKYCQGTGLREVAIDNGGSRLQSCNICGGIGQLNGVHLNRGES